MGRFLHLTLRYWAYVFFNPAFVSLDQFLCSVKAKKILGSRKRKLNLKIYFVRKTSHFVRLDWERVGGYKSYL